MDWTGSLHNSPESNKLQTSLRNTDLPDDKEIKDKLKEKEISEDSELESDSDIPSDSDIEGSMNQMLWDVYFPKDKAFENTTEDLRMLLHRLPVRITTRQRQANQNLFLHSDQKYFDNFKKILDSPLVDEDIDQDILMENLESVRNIIRKNIEKKSRVAVRDCSVGLERLEL